MIGDLCTLLTSYLEPSQVEGVRRACDFAAAAHAGQQRASGEPYVQHPIAVARILAEMRMDHESIMAAILHDVIEDTPTAKEQIATQFGAEVAELVDGVSKLTQIRFSSKAEAQAENFRKMMLAMVRDIRVILVKLADRVHNMRTVSALPPAKRRRIARETLEIYAPIANRLGMNAIRLELEDLGFAGLYPHRHRVLAEAVKKARGNRKEIVDQDSRHDGAAPQRRGAAGSGGRAARNTSTASIAKCGKRPCLSPRCSTSTPSASSSIKSIPVTGCWARCTISTNRCPVSSRTTSPSPRPTVTNPCTPCCSGLMACPSRSRSAPRKWTRWPRPVSPPTGCIKPATAVAPARRCGRGNGCAVCSRCRKSAGNSLEFLENVKIDLFPDEVYVFTPKGEIMKLPRGATAVDFAYNVHTDVGNTCVAAKIDRRLAPLRSQLGNGQTVEIITAPGARPNPAWLNFVVSGKARANIRHYLKNLKREEAIQLGRRLLDRSLAANALSFEQLPPERLAATIKELKFASADDLLESIGLGNRVATLVARHLIADLETPPPDSKSGVFKKAITRYVPAWLRGGERDAPRPLAIKGTEGMVVAYAKCCRPIPGDPIVGFVTAGRGIVIHTAHCKNLAEFRNRPEKWIDVAWESEVQGDFPVEIRLEVANQRGALATVAAGIAEMDANIDNVSMEERDGRYSALTLLIEVHDRGHLARVIRRVRSIDIVARITRTKG